MTRSSCQGDAAPEVSALLDALDACAPNRATGCLVWTVHELTAHLLAGAEEIARHVEAYQNGLPIPATRSLEERESPWRATTDEVLREELDLQMRRLAKLLDEVLHTDENATIL